MSNYNKSRKTLTLQLNLNVQKTILKGIVEKYVILDDRN